MDDNIYSTMNPLYDIPAGMTSVTPNNNKDIDKKYKGIWLESGGDLAVQFKDGSTHIYGGLVKHQDVWGHFKRILSTGTTITSSDIYLMKSDIASAY